VTREIAADRAAGVLLLNGPQFYVGVKTADEAVPRSAKDSANRLNGFYSVWRKMSGALGWRPGGFFVETRFVHWLGEQCWMARQSQLGTNNPGSFAFVGPLTRSNGGARPAGPRDNHLALHGDSKAPVKANS